MHDFFFVYHIYKCVDVLEIILNDFVVIPNVAFIAGMCSPDYPLIYSFIAVILINLIAAYLS